jgi:hypothetical protein
MATTTALDWRPFFPEATVRPLQEEILDFLTAYYDEADAFFVEAPAGVGKSAIAVTLARWHYERTRHGPNLFGKPFFGNLIQPIRHKAIRFAGG